MKPSDEKHTPWVSLLLSIASVLGGAVAVWMTQQQKHAKPSIPASSHGDAEVVVWDANRYQATFGPFSQDLAEVQIANALTQRRLAAVEGGVRAGYDALGVLAETFAELCKQQALLAMDWDALPQRFVFEDASTGQKQAFVLVQGDRSTGTMPLYVATTETTWDWFGAWAFGDDLDDNEMREQMYQGLRPPIEWGYINHSGNMGMGQKPAIGMSLHSAKLFAQHQADLGGLSIRLPTEAEWEHVYETTQGPLDEVPENLDVVAVHDGNAGYETQVVGSKQANAHGIHDLLGNVSEWVVDSSDHSWVVRGGSFATYPEAPTGAHREVASQEVWNKTWPVVPNSMWWFIDHHDHGFRLVCDPSPALLVYLSAQASDAEARP